jgi:ribosomal protein S7
MVPGHSGKKHKITSGPLGGSAYNALHNVEKALEIIEKKENAKLTPKPAGTEGVEQAGRPATVNPIEVLVRAIENSALTEEIISYQMGSIMAREAVITSPQRRIDKTLRFFAQGAYRRSFNKKKHLAEALAEEILLAYAGSAESTAMRERERIEREAAGAR